MEIKEFIARNLENMKADLAELVSFNSVNSDDEPPFGSQNHKVLDKALQLMEAKGLETHNLDYYCGYGQTGQGEKLIGILAHLDVVPAGEGWEGDPFKLREKDGYLYGRGVSDDKGAAVASMYALKYLIEEGYPFRKRVRLILGCNEETGSRCIAHYVEKEGHVDYGFTPDGDFPGIYAEKGICGALISAKGSKIKDIHGGDVSNAVCKKVEATVPAGSFAEEEFAGFMKQHNITYECVRQDDELKLTVHGVSAHASLPDDGVNAFNHLMEGLYAAGFADPFTDWFHKYIGLDLHGEKLGYEALKDEATDTSINLGVIFMQDDKINVTLDMRFPVQATSEQVIKLLDVSNEYVTVEVRSCVEPLYFDKGTPMIRALKRAYEDVTGDTEREMEAIGGGTYAKEMHNIIAWGCAFPGETNHIHDVNEQLNIENWQKQVELYVEAIRNLNEIAD